MENPVEIPEWKRLFERVANTDDLQQCIVDISKSLQVEYVTFYIDHGLVKTTGRPYMKTNYPAEWVRRYLVMDYARIDPVFLHCNECAEPRFWADLTWDGPELASFLKDASSLGVPTCGYVIPVHDKPSGWSMLNFSSHCDADEWLEKIKELAPALKDCAQLLHTKAVAELGELEPDYPSLTQREIECLSWVARGKDAGSIAIILGLSEHTVRDYCKSARHKLGCSTLYQAVYLATLWRILDETLHFG